MTASSVLRLGTQHSITRSSPAFAITVSILSGFMLQPALRRISPVILAVVILWRLRTSGVAATLSCMIATGAVIGNIWLLIFTVSRGEVYTCIVGMHSRFQPTWLTYYSACTPLAAHNWLILFTSTLLAYWLVTFLPSRPQRAASKRIH